MFNFGGMEILVILAVALLVLGPDKLPKFMRTVGKALGELRRASTEFQRTVNTELVDEAKPAAPGVSADAAPEETTPDPFEPEMSASEMASPDQVSPNQRSHGRPIPRARRRIRKHEGTGDE